MEASSKKHKQKLSLLALSSGLSIGTGLGISLGVAFDNIPVGLSMGAGVGLSVGMALYHAFKSKSCSEPK